MKQEACLQCHGDELEAVEDTHPPKKFTDPRNADKLALVDARRCVSCHREHRPAMTHAMAVTLPPDFCIYCHEDIGEERPSHRNLNFDTCRDCHLYHDNSALYEEFLAKHVSEPATRDAARVPSRNLLASYRLNPRYPIRALTANEQDAPAEHGHDDRARDWEGSAHAAAGVNCMACHSYADSRQPEPADGSSSRWVEKPDHRSCMTCHEKEAKGFLDGRHGMRLAHAGLRPMRTDLARQPMDPDSHATVTCVACHRAHRFDSRRAAVRACLGCHADEHSRAYPNSVHARLWQAERAGRGTAGSGVSCATCHLPRQALVDATGQRILVQHNQNLNLRPNQKMIRSVCMHCHGLGFSIDALADRDLVRKNFAGRPTRHLASLDMVEKRIEEAR